MTAHAQYVTVRNSRGQEMMDLVRDRFEISPTISTGDRRGFVMQTVEADVKGKRGEAPKPMPKWLGQMVAWLLQRLGPTGMEFARYSIDYHYLRNYLYVNRYWKGRRAEEHIPQYIKQILSEYEPEISKLRL